MPRPIYCPIIKRYKHRIGSANIRPTFRPDSVVNLDFDNWRTNIDRLSEVSGITVHNYATLIEALENRRTYFKQMGATATDHAALTPYTINLSPTEADAIFQRALKGEATPPRHGTVHRSYADPNGPHEH